ncbi:hypothetical protein [Dendronalium sp. ChiSLP03b]|uniref:hypothetical protein n=1 Tax=Dendronalium sp. ChiSLP03b TaxID=3075381 RepID=UPI002AD36028|nr:hypothetical protein [Dendronalium sp. ChiSLP03b]MDZ8203135.1 hypothetical protein [Dendronalium sp. ChiSLP03b]
MWNQNRVSILLAAALIIVPTLLSAPANAQTKVHVVGERDRDWNRDSRRNYREDRREQRTRIDRRDWNRDNEANIRVVRLRNGDVRYPNGEIIAARRLVRLRNQDYWRLPNGDILLPSQEIVPARRLVRLQNGDFRLPNGVIVQINL